MDAATNQSSKPSPAEVEEENTLNFLDSLDDYLILIETLSSTLRQGWLELASARYSMGASRVSSALLSLKHHPAATVVEVDYDHAGSVTRFGLCKWAAMASSDNKSSSLEKGNIEQSNGNLTSSDSGNQGSSLESSKGSKTNTSPLESNGSETIASPNKTENPFQKERAKVLSMFGTLVSPKLRASQLSFETALETLVEIANARSSILEAHDALSKGYEEHQGITNGRV